MKITLRKANALQNAIQDRIKTIDCSLTIALNEFKNPDFEIEQGRSKLVSADQRRADLTMVMYTIRALVGKANAESGVSDSLARAAYIDKRIGHLKSLAEATPTEDLEVVRGQLRKIADDKSERSFYRESTVTVGLLHQGQIDQYNNDLSILKKEKQSINDRVLELNIRTEIELIDDIVKILMAEQLI